MVKLIRLQGDADVNNEEIRNTFKQPIIISPNAKVALMGCSAILNDQIINENFVIGNSNKYFKIGHMLDKQVKKLYTAEIAAGSYSAGQFVEEFGTAANYAASDFSASFLQHQTSVVNNKLLLETHQAFNRVPNFDDSTYWSVWDGDISASTTRSVTAGASGVSLSMGSKPNTSIPMFHNRFEATLVNCSGGAFFNAAECELTSGTPFNEFWGVQITNANLYRVLIPDPEGDGAGSFFSLGQNWAANDQLSFSTLGGRLVVRITDASGNLKASYDEQSKIPRVLYQPNAYGLDWNIQLEANGKIDNCLCTYLVNNPDQGTVGDMPTSGLLQFVTPTNVHNTLLAVFAGFGMNGSAIIPYKGNPAKLQGRDDLLGLAAYPGILISVDGLGPLDSFDGSKDSRSQSNVVYVINDLSVVTSNQLQLDVPSPFFLSIKNSGTINVNELRARFLPSAGSLTNTAIAFSGKPSLTLLIDG